MYTLDEPQAKRLHRELTRALPGRGFRDNAIESEDVVQSTWLRLLERLPMFRGTGTLRTFAIGIGLNVRREIATRAARRARLTPFADVDPEYVAEVVDDTTAGSASMRAEVRAAMHRLSSRDRWLIEKRLLEERPYNELLCEFQRRFDDRITTLEGLRVACFHARRRLMRLVEKQ